MSQAGIINIAGGGGSGSPVETLTGNSGGAVPPTANNINILGGTGINIVGNPGTSTLTVTATAAGFAWSDQAVSFNAAKENGYFITAALTATLPAAPAEGDTIEFIVTTNTAMGFVIQANAGQKITINTMSSSVAGTATNSTSGDAIELIYRTVGTTWWCLSKEGNWSLA